MRFGALRIFIRKVVRCIKDIAVESGVHGLQNAVNSGFHPLERLFWLVMVVMALFGAGYVSWFQFRRYDSNPIVISLERDYRSWNGSLPAITLCYKNRLNIDLANEFILRKWNVNETDDDYKYFYQYMSDIVDATATNYDSITQYSNDKRVAEIDLLEIFQAVNSFRQEVFTFNEVEVEIKPLMTERGMCYSINSLNSDVINKNETSDPAFKDPIPCNYRRQECYLELQLADNDVVVVLHSPYEAYSYEMEIIDVSRSNEIQAFYKIEETVASRSVRDLSIEQRKCLFPEEKLDETQVFSKSVCLMNCRIEAALSLCNCVPFFYPFSAGPICTTTGMACLQEFSWPVWSITICECSQKCISSDYSLKQLIKRKWSSATSKITTASTLTEPKLTVKFEVVPPTTRIRRSVLFSFEDFLVSFGGAVSLFLGFSIWSISMVPYVILKHTFGGIAYLSSAKQRPATRKPEVRKNLKQQGN